MTSSEPPNPNSRFCFSFPALLSSSLTNYRTHNYRMDGVCVKEYKYGSIGRPNWHSQGVQGLGLFRGKTPLEAEIMITRRRVLEGFTAHTYPTDTSLRILDRSEQICSSNTPNILDSSGVRFLARNYFVRRLLELQHPQFCAIIMTAQNLKTLCFT